MALDQVVRSVSALLRTQPNRRPPKVVVLTGAGTSVSSGIPDFRSPGGLYSTLRPALLTATPQDRELMTANPQFVIDRALFMRNQLPYHEVRRPFILGSAVQKWKPTLSHAFCRFLHDRGLLARLYTQNIDGIDMDVGVPRDKIVSVHGSIRDVVCEACDRDPYADDFAAYVEDVRSNIKDIYGVDASAPTVSTPIPCRLCGKHCVKPSTTLFNSSLPSAFFDAYRRDFQDGSDVDLLFVLGTSLQVYPAAGIPDAVPRRSKRVLVNLENAGAFDFGNGRDFFLQGDCDEIVLKLIAELGWMESVAQMSALLCDKSSALIEKNSVG